MTSLVLLIAVAALSVQFFSITLARPTEQERVQLWHEKHTWPPTWHDESQGYRELMENREREIMALTGSYERWENWMQFVQSLFIDLLLIWSFLLKFSCLHRFRSFGAVFY